jgi:hypothetical protein
MRFLRRRRAKHARPIDEAAAYARSYGHQSDDVRIVTLPPRRPRDQDVLARGEALRHAFLERLERRRSATDPTRGE